MVVRGGPAVEHGPDHHVGRSGPGVDHADSVGKTIAGAKFNGQGNDLVVDTSSFYKPSQAGAYPIVDATYEIVCSKYPGFRDRHGGKSVHAGHNWAGPRWLGPIWIHSDAELVPIETGGGRERNLMMERRR